VSSKAHLDCADWGIPLSMLAAGWTEPPNSDLGKQYLGPLVCYIVSLALKFPTESQTILSIDLALCHIGDCGTKWLCGCLQSNKSVTFVNVDVNGISALIFEYMGSLLAHSEALTTWACGGNRVVSLECAVLQPVSRKTRI